MKQTQYFDQDNLVITRGKIFNDTTIKLPEEWEDLVDPRTITVSLTPCGIPQEIFVKTVDIKEVRIFSYNKLPIECYYHIFAQTK